MKTNLEILLFIILASLIVLGIESLILMVAWNMIIPNIFDVGSLTYLKSCILTMFLNLISVVFSPKITINK